MKKRVIIIVGPTAVGKTGLSLMLAERLNGEIVSADSRQIYKYMNIGTATPSDDELARVPHHFINLLEPHEEYNAGKYSKDARLKIDEIITRRKIPIVVGGSGLYIKALVEGIFESPEIDDGIRAEIFGDLKKYGLEYLYNRLKKVDPPYAAKISAKDKQRITRALEVFLSSGKPFSAWHEKTDDKADFEPIKYGLTMERERLYERINRRVDLMFENGLIAEAEGLLKLGYSRALNALNTVGYKEVFQYLADECSLEEARELIKRNSRHYAKRQLTWFRKDKEIKWIDLGRGELSASAAEIASDFLLRN
jgi:tRNA dimethylallyltransferase